MLRSRTMTAPTFARKQVERSATSRVIVMKYWSQLGRWGVDCGFCLFETSANAVPSDFDMAELPQHPIVLWRVMDYLLAVTVFRGRRNSLRLHERERHRAERDDK